MKVWIKLLKSWTQKSKDADGNPKETEFKEGDIIQVTEEISKSLIQLGYAEATEEPKVDTDLDKSLESLTKSVETTVSKVLEKALTDVSDKFETSVEKNFARPKDPNSLEEGYGFKNANHFFKAVSANGQGITVPGMEFLSKAPSGQNISTDSEGGFLVPEPVADRIWSNLMDEPDSIIPQTLQMTTAGNSMKVPRLFESSRKTGAGQRNGGVISYWLDEADALTSSKFTTGKENLELHKLAALVYASSEILEDSGFSIENFINQLAPRAINYEVNNAFFNGSGVGKPLGVRNSDALIEVANGTRAGGVPANNRIFHWTVSQMYHRNEQRDTAIWYGHPNLIEQLQFLVFDDNSDNRPIYFPTNGSGGFGGATQSPFGTMYGRPVVPMEFLPQQYQPGSLLFVSWRDYATLQKAAGGIKFASSIHVRFLNDETAYRFTFRIDGRPLWTGPREDLNGDTTRSPFTSSPNQTGGGSSSGL